MDETIPYEKLPYFDERWERADLETALTRYKIGETIRIGNNETFTTCNINDVHHQTLEEHVYCFKQYDDGPFYLYVTTELTREYMRVVWDKFLGTS